MTLLAIPDSVLAIPDLVLPAVPASVDTWVESITAEWRRSVEGILRTGEMLIAAKAELPHGAFQDMIRDRLPFKVSTARYLMQIARNPVLSNRQYLGALPASWSTLKDLARLDPETAQDMISTGTITPDLTGRQAADLLPRHHPGPSDEEAEEALAWLLEHFPTAEPYGDALLRRDGLLLALQEIHIEDVSKPLPGASWSWPRYTGCKWYSQDRRDRPAVVLPEFSEDEWEEFLNLDPVEECRVALEEAAPPLVELMRLPTYGTYEHSLMSKSEKAQWVMPLCPLLDRRTYDPAYGGEIVEADECRWTLRHTKGDLFVKRGWGDWMTVEFNDGTGGRERRRYFRHDYHENSAIRLAMDTVDPFSISDENLHKLEILKVMPGQAGWAYARHKTVDRDVAVAALEHDLARLRAAEQLTPEEIKRHAADWLQEYIPEAWVMYEYREGRLSYPRHPDGTRDMELLDKLCRAVCDDYEARRAARR